jgi:hypothetical protein
MSNKIGPCVKLKNEEACYACQRPLQSMQDVPVLMAHEVVLLNDADEVLTDAMIAYYFGSVGTVMTAPPTPALKNLFDDKHLRREQQMNEYHLRHKRRGRREDCDQCKHSSASRPLMVEYEGHAYVMGEQELICKYDIDARIQALREQHVQQARGHLQEMQELARTKSICLRDSLACCKLNFWKDVFSFGSENWASTLRVPDPVTSNTEEEGEWLYYTVMVAGPSLGCAGGRTTQGYANLFKVRATFHLLSC